MAVTVRPATLDDLDEMMRQRAEVAAEGRWIGAEVPLDEVRDRASFTAGIEAGNTFVAEVGGEIVGILGVEVPAYLVADIGMQVRDGYRGQGVGSALVEKAIEHARARGCHKIALQHWPHNERARALYEKYGFEQEGYLRRQYPRKDGEIWDAVVMGLLL
jgi:RimJ/RimL family protein N-acetyltransferase